MALILNGDGSIQSLVAGGLPDATVQPSDLTQPLTAGTAIATTSGTSHDFTSIPSWVKRITVMLNGVSTNGTSQLRAQIGSGSVETSGYAGSSSAVATGVGSQNFTSGIDFNDGVTAASVRSGQLTFTLIGSNIWTFVGILGQTDQARMAFAAGMKTTAGTLDRLRLTTVNGTDTFDAGSVNILYE